MPSRRRPPPAPTLESAFDELRFGRERTLNLRASLPTAVEAARRAEAWLRERQVAKAGEVLVVTGRGRGSEGGVPVVRDAVARLLAALRARGVVAEWSEHTAGSFVVRLAPVHALYPTARPTAAAAAGVPAGGTAGPPALSALDPSTRTELRALALRALDALGMHAPDRVLVDDEMARQFNTLAAALPAVGDREAALRAAAAAALRAYDADP